MKWSLVWNDKATAFSRNHVQDGRAPSLMFVKMMFPTVRARARPHGLFYFSNQNFDFPILTSQLATARGTTRRASPRSLCLAAKCKPETTSMCRVED